MISSSVKLLTVGRAFRLPNSDWDWICSAIGRAPDGCYAVEREGEPRTLFLAADAEVLVERDDCGAVCEACGEVEIDEGDTLCSFCRGASGAARELRDECGWSKGGDE